MLSSNSKKFKFVLKKTNSSPVKNLFPKLSNRPSKLLSSSSSCKQIKFYDEKPLKRSKRSHQSTKDLFNAKKIDNGTVTDRLINKVPKYMKINRNSDPALPWSKLSTTFCLRNSYESFKLNESSSRKTSSKKLLYSGNDTKNSSSVNKSTIKTLNRVNSSIEINAENLHSTCEDEQIDNEEELHIQFVKLFQKKKQFYNNLSAKLTQSNNVLNYNDYYAL